MNKKTFKFYIALWGAKAGMILLKIFRRNATFLPGKFALTICPDFMKMLEKPKTIIGVTGTNGKTTVCNMIEDVLADNGYDFIDNKYENWVNLEERYVDSLSNNIYLQKLTVINNNDGDVKLTAESLTKNINLKEIRLVSNNIPTIDLIIVVLPAPLCPMNANISPLFTLKLTSFNACLSLLYVLLTSLISIIF